GLGLALTALGVGRGDEVLTPAFSFVASATTIVMAGATPVFVDVEPDTLTMDPDALTRALTPRTKVVMPVHLYGHPAAIDRIAAFAQARGLAVLEDNAQAVGAMWQGRPLGGWGDAACLSFYPTKNLGACGDAGMLVTTRDDVAERVRRLRHHGDTGVGTAVHYPLPVPGQPLFAADGEKRWPEAHRAAREVLSLPCYPEMSDAEVEGVIDAVRRACEDLG